MENINNLKPKYLCLSGAGIYGISFLGALKHIDLSDVEVYIGSSAGGIISTLLTIGFTSEEIYKIVYTINLGNFQEISIDNLMTKFGLDNMSKVHQFFVALFMEKKENPNLTFLEHYQKTKKTLIITGSCLNTGETEYFSWKTTPNMSLITAMKITMAFIGIFTPVLYNGKTYCDGALFDFFPIKYILKKYSNKNISSKDYVLGFTIKSLKYNMENINSVSNYLLALYSGIVKNYCDYMTFTDNDRLNISSNENMYDCNKTDYKKIIDNNTKNKNNISKTKTKSKTKLKSNDEKNHYHGHIIYIYIDIESSKQTMNLSLDESSKKKIYEMGSEHLVKYLLNPFV